MEQRRELLVEEIRTAEQARGLLAELERRLKNKERPDLEDHLAQLDRFAASLPEDHVVRLLVEDTAAYARNARMRGSGKAGSVASRSRSKSEGRISRLRGMHKRLDELASKEW